VVQLDPLVQAILKILADLVKTVPVVQRLLPDQHFLSNLLALKGRVVLRVQDCREIQKIQGILVYRKVLVVRVVRRGLLGPVDQGLLEDLYYQLVQWVLVPLVVPLALRIQSLQEIQGRQRDLVVQLIPDLLCHQMDPRVPPVQKPPRLQVVQGYPLFLRPPAVR